MRVGVTGHRQADRLGSIDELVDGVLERLGRDTEGTPVVVSSIAEGADRLVARLGLSRGWDLVVILPFPRHDYETDFTTDASRAEFDELLGRASAVDEVASRPTREDAYLAAGHAVVDDADVVLALWDGHPARGRGGTAEVVEYARSLGRPLVWIDVARREPTLHLESLELPETR